MSMRGDHRTKNAGFTSFVGIKRKCDNQAGRLMRVTLCGVSISSCYQYPTFMAQVCP